MSGGINRVFMDWRTPALPGAVGWVLENLEKWGRVRLTPWTIVLPTARSRRRFLQLLAAECVAKKVRLEPGRVITVGQLPELLYQAGQPIASELECRLAWMAALDGMAALNGLPERQLRDLLPESLTGDAAARENLAETLQGLHVQLGTEGRSFHSIAEEVKKLAGFSDAGRWNALATIQQLYYDLLKQNGLWDRQAARNVAARRGECRSEKQILLVGIADMNPLIKTMLGQKQVRPLVTALVFAGPKYQSGFDEFGSLVTGWWTAARLPLDDRAIRVVDRPLDQAKAVEFLLGQLPAGLATDEITVCTPDEDVAVHTQRLLGALGIATRRLAGTRLSMSAVARMVEAIIEWIRRKDFDSLATLLRHPDFFAAVSGKIGAEDWLAALDEFQNQYLPGPISLKKFSRAPRGTASALFAATAKIFRATGQLLGPLLELAEAKEASLKKKATWPTAQKLADAWARAIENVYGDCSFAGDTPDGRKAIESLELVGDGLEQVATLGEQWHVMLDLETVGDLILQWLESQAVSENDDPAAIELAGWLDLALDDARAMIVTGFNEHNIPGSQSPHPLLPNSLCQQLGLLDSNRRHARDAWVLAMVVSQREHVWLVAGRRDAQNSPRLPSRLLFAADDETVRRRARAFFGFHGSTVPRRWMSAATPPAGSQQLEIPRPKPIPPIKRISVTRLRDYLKCPYRFYLSAVMELQEADDKIRELDGGAFGSLAHDVLEDFGNSDVANSSDRETIESFLVDTLTQRYRVAYPLGALPAAAMQMVNLEKRLKEFAAQQAVRRQEGWQIVRVEPKVEFEMLVDGEPFTIVGKIDRVDRHDNGQLAVWDYKTSDSAKRAMAAHQDKNGEWTDFQLPLYRHLLTRVLDDAQTQLNTIGLGYVLLPRDVGKVEFDLAEWTPEQLLAADEEARDVLRKIRAQEFWPMADTVPDFSEALSAICQDGAFERWCETDGEYVARKGGNT